MPKNKITNNKLNIAIAISSFFPSIGGAQVTAQNLASYLHEKNHKVTMIISWKNWKKIKNENFSYRIVPMLPGHQSLIGKKIIGRIYSYILNKYLYFLTKKYKFNVIKIGKQLTTDTMNQYFEKAIKETPELYGWEYKKFRKLDKEKRNIY